MASLYERFLADGPVRSLISGKEYRFSPSGRPTTSLRLADAFDSKQADCTFKRLKRLERLVSESDIGRRVLADVKRNGTRIHLDSSVTDCCGFFQEESNSICLNARETDEVLASTLVHESRHVWQSKQPLVFDADLKIKPFFMMGFAIEADAVATETLFAFEMKNVRPEIWASLLQSKYACVAKGFEEGLRKTNRIASGLNGAFEEWYNTSVVPLYADDYIGALDKFSQTSYGEDRSFLSKNVSPAQIANALCRFGKDVYLQDPSVLETPEKLHLQPKQKERLDDLLTKWANRTRRSENIGSEAIFIKEKDGSFSPGKKPNVQKTNEAPLWVQNLKAAGRF